MELEAHILIHVFIQVMSFVLADDKRVQTPHSITRHDENQNDSSSRHVIYKLIKTLLYQSEIYEANIESAERLFENVEYLRSLQTGFSYTHDDQNIKSSRNMEAFMEWALDKFYVNGVAPAIFREGGVGMVATKQLTNGDTILGVPISYTMSSSDAAKVFEDLADELDAHQHLVPDPIWKQYALISLLLLSEKDNPNSTLKRYLDILPESKQHPLSFGIQEFRYLHGSRSYLSCLEQSHYLIWLYAFVYKYMVDNSGQFLDHGFTADTLTYDAFRWALTMALTRSFAFESHTMLFVPMWDLFNHGKDMVTSAGGETGSKIDWNISETDDPQTIFECSVIRDVYIGEHISMEYCPEKEMTLSDNFKTFGFVKREKERIAIAFRLHRTDASYRAKKRALDKLVNYYGITEYVFQHSKEAMRLAPWDYDLLLALGCGRSRNGLETPLLVSMHCWKRMFLFAAKQTVRAIALYNHDLQWYEKAVANEERPLSMQALINEQLLAELKLLHEALIKFIRASKRNLHHLSKLLLKPPQVFYRWSRDPRHVIYALYYESG